MHRKILRWLIVLVVVGALVGLIESKVTGVPDARRTSGYGTGSFAHLFQVEIELETVSESGHKSKISIEGWHPETFMLTGHRSPEYKRIALTWNDNGRQVWSHWVEIDAMELIREDGKLPLTSESWQMLLNLKAVEDRDLEILKEVKSLIQSAARGGLPPPSIDDYRLGKPLNGLMRHWARERGHVLGHATATWVLIWSFFGAFCIYRNTLKERETTNMPNQSP